MRQKLLHLKRSFAWHNSVKRVTRLFSPLLGVVRAISGGLEKEVIRSIFVLLVRLHRLSRHNGSAYACRYMKYSSLYVMKYVARDRSVPIHSGVYDLKVSLCTSGLPRLLPSYVRARVRSGDPVAVRWVLTVLSLYRVLPFPGSLKLTTITDPWTGSIPKDAIRFIPVFLRTLSPSPFLFE